ncbi:MAG: PAS domain S-box protein [Bdellovibrionia bacterium]
MSTMNEPDRLRSTLDLLNAGVSHVTVEGKILWVNRFYCEFYGYTLEEMQQLTLKDTTHPDDFALQAKFLKRVISGELETAAMDRRCRRKDGTYVWANVSTRMLRDADGKPLYFVTFLQDIQQRKAIELSLRESQSRLEQALSLAKLGSWERDLATDKATWNAECYAIYGGDPHQEPFSLKKLSELVHPEDRERFKARLEVVMKNTSDNTLVYRIIRPTDGAIRTIRAVVRRIPGMDGGLGKMLGAVQDITEWVEQEAEKRQTEELLKLVLDTAPARIGYVTRDLRYRFVNRRYEIDFGMTSAQIVGKTVYEVLGEETARSYEADYQAVFSGKLVEVEREFPFKNGKRQINRVMFAPDFSPKREVLGFVTMIQDVTEEREKEKMILEQRQKLISSAKLAALGEMAGGISHEINNPLAVIHARAEGIKDMALRGNVDMTKLAYSAEKIELTSKRIAKIVKALRNIARDGEKDPFLRTPVKSIIEDAVEICRERFVHHSIDFQVEDVSPALVMECRAVQISQVVLNFLSNAFDAVKTSSDRWVKIEVREIDDHVQISVSDNGSGVSPEIRDKIFQPFFTTKEPGQGTGLGLSVSKAIIDDHRGTVQIDDSVPFTRFVVTLPMKQKKP